MKKNAKRRFLPVVGLAVLLLVAVYGFSPRPARAAAEWFTCRVNLTGPGGSRTFVNLTDLAEKPAFVEEWFLMPNSRSREMLAVALTAINGDRKVLIQVDLEKGDPEPILDGFYLKAPAESEGLRDKPSEKP
jgi:hypothetical protein